LKDYILDVKDTPQASVSKADEKESKGSALSEKDSKNLADLAKTNRIIAKALVESAREVRREKRRGVEPRIPSASTGATVTPSVTAAAGNAQVAALLREPVAQQPEGAPGTPGPVIPVPDTGLPDRRTPPQPPKPPVPTPKPPIPPIPPGAPAASIAAPVALAAAAVAAPFVATRQQIEKIKADPNAPGLEFNPLAQTLRGEAKTVGQAGQENINRAVGQMKWGEVKAFVESDLTDKELYEQLGRNRKELKEWLEKHKDGKTPYDKFTAAPAVASRAAESMIPWETPAVEPEPEVGAPPPITGMESAFVPTPPPTAPAPDLEVGPTREMFEADQAQQARNVVMRRRKRPERSDAAARQQAEIEAGNVVPEPTQPQRVPKPSREDREIQRMKENNRKVREAAQSLGLDPNKVTGRFEGGKLTGIIDETGKQVDVSDRLSEEDKKSVNAARSMRAAMQGTQQPTPQVEAAKPKEEETGPVSGTEAAIMRAEGLDPENEIDRKLYRRRRDIQRRRGGTQPTPSGVEQKPQLTQPQVEPAVQAQPTPEIEPAPQPQQPAQIDSGPVSGTERAIMQGQGLDPDDPTDREIYRRRSAIQAQRSGEQMRQQGYAPVDERGRVVGAELNQMSVQNNDLQRQGNAPSSQPIVIQNNNNAATQTTVTPPAQPRVDSSFSRVMDIRNVWD
jgi:hypothetical protein